MTAIVGPQVIVRAMSASKVDRSVYFVFFVGIVVFALALVAFQQMKMAVPRRSVHQLAERYISGWAGVLAASARILAYALIALLGVELVVSAITAVAPIEQWSSHLAVALIVILALPVLGTKRSANWGFAVALIGIVALAALLLYGMFLEMTRAINLPEIIQARQDAYAADFNAGRAKPAMELLSALFAAAVLLLVTERVMVDPNERRPELHEVLRVFLPTLILIALTLYFVVTLQMPGRRLGIPAVSAASAFLGANGRFVIAILFALLGATTAYMSYLQIPRLIRELAVDGLLPRRLAAQDAVAPRRQLLLVIAVVSALVVWFLDSTHSIAMVFIFVSFTWAAIGSLAMVFRSRKILAESTSLVERKTAKQLRWIFIGFGLLAIVVLGAIAVSQPVWAIYATVSLLAPAALLSGYRRGRVKLYEALRPAPEAGIRIPTRVHGVVLINHLDQPALRALAWARSSRLSSLTAVCVDTKPEDTKQLRKDWQTHKIPIPLTVLGTPNGAARTPVVEFVRTLSDRHINDVVEVFIPRIVPPGRWDKFVLRHVVPRVVIELMNEQRVMVTQVPFQLEAMSSETEAS